MRDELGLLRFALWPDAAFETSSAPGLSSKVSLGSKEEDIVGDWCSIVCGSKRD